MSQTRMLILTAAVLGLLPLLAGCQESDAKAKVDVAKHRSRLILVEEPDGGQGVEDTRDAMPREGEFVVVGRVGGRPEPWTKGQASFFVADASLILASDGKHDCDDPSCAYCSKSEALAQKKMLALVQFVDEDGQVVPVNAQELFDIKENDMVVVRGTAKIAKDKWLVITANGLYVRR
jgi:hypothetical protein